MDDSFLLTPAQVLKRFGVDAKRGLSSDQVGKAREKHGKNELPEGLKQRIWYWINLHLFTIYLMKIRIYLCAPKII